MERDETHASRVWRLDRACAAGSSMRLTLPAEGATGGLIISSCVLGKCAHSMRVARTRATRDVRHDGVPSAVNAIGATLCFGSPPVADPPLSFLTLSVTPRHRPPPPASTFGRRGGDSRDAQQLPECMAFVEVEAQL